MGDQVRSTPTPLHELPAHQLVTLGHEYLLAGHLIDRAGMPQLIARYGIDTMRDVAIEEWMSASPVYTRRMQRALGFEGDDVTTIFKGMQLDIGAPPQFMDFRYTVHDEGHGEFHLDSCGALMDVEPMGDDYVVAMCHHIEDPTFDATAAATNPKARMRPVHRPPREPADRHPHCHWTVVIEPDAVPIPEPEGAIRMAASRAASVVLERVDRTAAWGSEPGRTDYAGPLAADLRLDELAPAKLVEVLEEVCLQGHLLAMAFMAAVADRSGWDEATEVGLAQLVGIAGLTADRIGRALELGASRPEMSGADRSGDSPDQGVRSASAVLDDVATVLGLHPALGPRPYVAVELERAGEVLTVRLGSCDALHETVAPSWPMLLASAPGGTRALDSIVGQVDPRAFCTVVDEGATDGAGRTWEVTLGAEPRPEPDEVVLTRFSTGADFKFQTR